MRPPSLLSGENGNGDMAVTMVTATVVTAEATR